MLDFLERRLPASPGSASTSASVLTDNGVSYRSHAFADRCRTFGPRHRRTRSYIPRAKGKAQCLIRERGVVGCAFGSAVG